MKQNPVGTECLSSRGRFSTAAQKKDALRPGRTLATPSGKLSRVVERPLRNCTRDAES